MKCWIGVVGLAHTKIAVEESICQFNHGKRAPLDQMSPGDRFAIYSPKEEIRSKPGVTSVRASLGRQLTPGSRLVREWNGRSHSVEVVEKGFEWNGQTYRSLSAVAEAITGAKWSGPRFFGL